MENEFIKTLASQTILISTLLGGFSIAIIANLLISDLNTRLLKIIMILATLVAGFFLVNVFAMSLADWSKSKKLGKFTTAIGFLTLILILIVI